MNKIFHKIHLWLSVPFGLFITLICFGGAMLVFEKEITEWCRPELYYVDKQGERPLPMDSLMQRVTAALPDSVEATGLTVSPDPERTWQVSLSKPRRASVYADPYTGEVKGRGERLPFFDTMFHLHRWLLGDSQSADGGMSVGKLLVGISTIALVLILITGVIIWWPRNRKMLKSRLTVSATKGWHRFWYDLHVSAGIYATVFLLLMALTGLTWSFPWYRTGFYGLFGIEATAGGGHHGGGAQRGDGDRKDGRERHGRPDGEGRSSRQHDGERREEHHRHETGGGRNGRSAMADGTGRHRRDRSRLSARRDNTEAAQPADTIMTRPAEPRSPFAQWQKVYDGLAGANPGFRQITMQDGTAGVVPEGRMSLRAADRYEFDPSTGEITATKPYREQDKAAKARGSVYMLHVGSWGGMLTRIIAFLAAIIGATLPLTGYYLWIRRLVNKSKKPSPARH